MVEKVKEIRCEIEALIGLTETLGLHNNNINDSVRSLRLGKMWLGKALGEIGEQTPYENGNNTSTNVIDPKSDTSILLSDDVWGEVDMTNEVQVAKVLREQIELQLFKIGELFGFSQGYNDLTLFVEHARMHLAEGKMWLGEYLSGLKDRNDKNKSKSLAGGMCAYQAYVDAMKPNVAPGTLFDQWSELSQFQQQGWIAVYESGFNNEPLS